MMALLSPHRKQESGFVLLAVLMVLTALTLGIGFIATQSAAVQQKAYDQADLQSWRLDRLATLSTILYVGATQRMSYAGLTTGVDPSRLEDEFNPFSGDAFSVTGDEIRLDDREYLGIGKIYFSLQDGGSLVGLRTERQFGRLDRLLQRFDLTSPQRRQLIAALKDYIDRDSLVSLDGIEASGYRRLGLLEPTNRFLSSPTQLLNVAGWPELLGNDLERLFDEVTVHSGNKSNFNSLTPWGMATIDDFEREIADRIIDHRKSGYFKTLADVNEVSGVVVTADELAFSAVPDVFLRVKLWHKSFRREERIGIRFTPTSPYAPWEIDYNVMYPRRAIADASRPVDNNDSIDRPIPSPSVFR